MTLAQGRRQKCQQADNVSSIDYDRLDLLCDIARTVMKGAEVAKNKSPLESFATVRIMRMLLSASVNDLHCQAFLCESEEERKHPFGCLPFVELHAP